MAATRLVNYLNTYENRDDCKCLFNRNTVPLKILDQCKWPPEKMMVQLKYMAASAPFKKMSAVNRSVKFILYMQFMVASALLRNSVSVEECLAATSFVKYWTLKKSSLR